MRKYVPLLKYLRRQPSPELVLSFEQIEEIVGDSLPASAYSASWWSSEKLGFWAPKVSAQNSPYAEIVANLVPGANRVRFRRLPAAQRPRASRDTGAMLGGDTA